MAPPGYSSDFTSEIKFVVGDGLGLRIRDWARARLAADPHGAGAHADEYKVSTLYLDTPARDVFNRRGSYGRSKYRIRRYGEESRVFLERKLRAGSRLAKRRTDIPLDALAAFREAGAPETLWFRRRLTMRRLEPICRVSYLRTARGTETEGGPARLTLDYALSAVAIDEFSFAAKEAKALLAGRMILELKYRGSMPAVFRQLADSFALTPQRSSKYRVAASALGLVGTGPNEDASRTVHV